MFEIGAVSRRQHLCSDRHTCQIKYKLRKCVNHNEAQKLGNHPCAPETKEKPRQGAGLRLEPPRPGCGDRQRGWVSSGKDTGAKQWERRRVGHAEWCSVPGMGPWGLEATASCWKELEEGLDFLVFCLFVFVFKLGIIYPGCILKSPGESF